MHCLWRTAAALLIGMSTPVALVASALAQSCVCPPVGAAFSGPVIQAEEPPPPLPEYEQPPMPAPGYQWTPGYWAWNNTDYYWVPGVWVEPPRVAVLWTPPYWGFVAGVYMFHPGYWAPHVGFYGGINYGFGYGGNGYAGGRWDNGRFFYNRAVNNFGAVHVGATYDAPVTINRTNIPNVSYNGGQGGLQVKPTPEQEQVVAEPHVPATPAQISHVRTASVNPEQFRFANQGKPAVAATPRPGDLKGPGVVPAKAPGAAQLAPVPNVAPKAEEKPAPGGKPLPGVTTPPGGKPLPGVQTPASGLTLPAERPLAAEPLNKPEEKLGPGAKPSGAPAQEKAQEKPLPGGAAKPPAVEMPKGLEKPRSLEKPMETPKALEKPQGPAKPPAGGKPMVPALSGGPPRPGSAPIGQPRPALAPNPLPKGPPAAAERKPEPVGKARGCGKPGLPACPK